MTKCLEMINECDIGRDCYKEEENLEIYNKEDEKGKGQWKGCDDEQESLVINSFNISVADECQ